MVPDIFLALIVLASVIPDICLALYPPALDPSPVQAKSAMVQPAAVIDSLRGFLIVHLA